MPVPRSSLAPRFSGTRVVEFCNSLEIHAANAGLPDAEIPSYVLRYCSTKVRQVIEHCEELEKKDWVLCRTFLIDLYESADRVPRPSADKLRAWIKQTGKNSAFVCRGDVDKYHQEFLARSSRLAQKKLITQTELDLRFYKGLPKEIKEKIRTKIPDDKTCSNPPDIPFVLKLCRALFDEDDLDAESDLDDEFDIDSNPSDSNSDTANIDDTPRKHRHSPHKHKKTRSDRFEQQYASGTPPVDTTTIEGQKRDRFDQLAEEMEKLRLSQEWLLSRLTPTSLPDVPQLISEDLIKYNQLGRLTRTNGNDLPRVPPGSEGSARRSVKTRDERCRTRKGHIATYIVVSARRFVTGWTMSCGR